MQVALTLFTLTLVSASESPPNEAATAFEVGRQALKRGELSIACAAFDRSYTLEPALGTLLNLASCLEKQGHQVRAWLRYNDAIAWAQRTHESEREQFARERAQGLKTRLSWVALASAEEIDAFLDGQLIHLSPVAVSVPIEPGTHTLSVERPGFERLMRQLTITGPGTTHEFVPALTPLPTRADPAPQAHVVPLPSPPLVNVKVVPASPLGAVMLIATGALITVAGIIGLVWSLTTYDTLQRARATGLPLISDDEINRLKWIYPSSWVAAGVGAALATVGFIILGVNSSNVSIVPTGSGAAVVGTF